MIKRMEQNFDLESSFFISLNVKFLQSYSPITETFIFYLMVYLYNMFQPSTGSSSGTNLLGFSWLNDKPLNGITLNPYFAFSARTLKASIIIALLETHDMVSWQYYISITLYHNNVITYSKLTFKSIVFCNKLLLSYEGCSDCCDSFIFYFHIKNTNTFSIHCTWKWNALILSQFHPRNQSLP
jgi:hypothetical protein